MPFSALSVRDMYVSLPATRAARRVQSSEQASGLCRILRRSPCVLAVEGWLITKPRSSRGAELYTRCKRCAPFSFLEAAVR